MNYIIKSVRAAADLYFNYRILVLQFKESAVAALHEFQKSHLGKRKDAGAVVKAAEKEQLLLTRKDIDKELMGLHCVNAALRAYDERVLKLGKFPKSPEQYRIE